MICQYQILPLHTPFTVSLTSAGFLLTGCFISLQFISMLCTIICYFSVTFVEASAGSLEKQLIMSLWPVETPSSISTGSAKLLSTISNKVPDTVSTFKGLAS